MHERLNTIIWNMFCIGPYPPPGNVHLAAIGTTRLTFRWSPVLMSSACSDSIEYNITAVNCGVCPRSTFNTSVACVYNVTQVTPNYMMCTFSVQTLLCDDVAGNASNLVTVMSRGTYPRH